MTCVSGNEETSWLQEENTQQGLCVCDKKEWEPKDNGVEKTTFSPSENSLVPGTSLKNEADIREELESSTSLMAEDLLSAFDASRKTAITFPDFRCCNCVYTNTAV